MLLDCTRILQQEENLPLYIIGDTNLIKGNIIDIIDNTKTSSQYFVEQIKEKMPLCTITPDNDNEITTSKMRSSIHGQCMKESKCDKLVKEKKDVLIYVPSPSDTPLGTVGTGGSASDRRNKSKKHQKKNKKQSGKKQSNKKQSNKKQSNKKQSNKKQSNKKQSDKKKQSNNKKSQQKK